MKKNMAGPKYPLATIAFYGPDNTRATKIAVGIVARADAEPEPLRRWVSGELDIRENRQVWDEVKAFLKEQNVKQSVVTDRIIGCPHEEGEDYPVGGKCPFCPFWHNRDRFTHEVVE